MQKITQCERFHGTILYATILYNVSFYRMMAHRRQSQVQCEAGLVHTQSHCNRSGVGNSSWVILFFRQQNVFEKEMQSQTRLLDDDLDPSSSNFLVLCERRRKSLAQRRQS